MSVFFTADLHLGHTKVAEIRMPKTQLLISGGMGSEVVTRLHDDLIVSNLRRLTKRDQLFILGDISSGSNTGQRHALAKLKGLRRETGAEFHLIPGNHDACHPQYRDAKKWWPEYLEVFDTIMPFASRKIGGRYVCLSHYPYQGEGGRDIEERYSQWRLKDEGRWLLHGHTHQPTPFRQCRYEINVGVDAWGMSPVPVEVIAETISAREKEIGAG